MSSRHAGAALKPRMMTRCNCNSEVPLPRRSHLSQLLMHTFSPSCTLSVHLGLSCGCAQHHLECRQCSQGWQNPKIEGSSSLAMEPQRWT